MWCDTIRCCRQLDDMLRYDSRCRRCPICGDRNWNPPGHAIVFLLLSPFGRVPTFTKSSHGMSHGMSHGIHSRIFHSIPDGLWRGYPMGYHMGCLTGYPIGYFIGFPMEGESGTWLAQCLGRVDVYNQASKSRRVQLVSARRAVARWVTYWLASKLSTVELFFNNIIMIFQRFWRFNTLIWFEKL